MNHPQPSTVTPSEPVRKLSWWRVLIALLLMIGVGYASVYGWQWKKEEQQIATQKPWFAAYVDVTSVPSFAFEQLGSTQTPQVVLAFIVADKKDPCQPSWGAYYSLVEAAENLDLDRRIARLQQQEGRVAISFGGLLNDELAVACSDPTRLLQAYQAVIERYQIDTIDLDLENAGLQNLEAAERRAKVIAQLQNQRRSQNQPLAVWVTLPVAPQGLTPDGTTAVSLLLKNQVDLAGVNVMTMNYGQSKQPETSMAAASKEALVQTHRQLGILYKQAGLELSSKTLWRKMGATPMIGQNDVVTEVFTHQDAMLFNQMTRDLGIGRLSMWSANRDLPCGENYVDVTVVSDACSGVPDPKNTFSHMLSLGYEGDLTQNAKIVTVSDAAASVQVVDNPATSPYQIWQESGAYSSGTKVVWHGNVYEAKWWTKGDLPDNPVLQAWETPWQLVGPVLPGEKPVLQPTLPKGTYPEWSGKKEYRGGERVLFEGVPFHAKWWNQGESPAASAAHRDSSPWEALTQQEIRDIIENGTASASIKKSVPRSN